MLKKFIAFKKWLINFLNFDSEIHSHSVYLGAGDIFHRPITHFAMFIWAFFFVFGGVGNGMDGAMQD